jgi:hypothetical protein
MKTANTPHENLSATLRILANRNNYEGLKFSAAIPRQELRKITADTCKSIYRVLRNECGKLSFTKTFVPNSG